MLLRQHHSIRRQTGSSVASLPTDEDHRIEETRISTSHKSELRS